MCASWIMFTSFAPFPIANVILFRLSLIVRTTSAFYLGVTLQQTTLSQSFVMWTKVSTSFLSSKMTARASPSTKKDFYWFIFFVSSKIFKQVSVSSLIMSYLFRLIWTLMHTIWSYIKRHDLAIFSAVSSLSPVNIQTLILALIRSAIVYGTLS